MRPGATATPRPGTLALGFAVALLASPLAHAANFQVGQIRNCTGLAACRLNLTGPAPGETLRVQHVRGPVTHR